MQAQLHTPFHWLIKLNWMVENHVIDADDEDNAMAQLESYGVHINQIIRFCYEGRDNDHSGRVAPIIPFNPKSKED